MQLSTKQGSHNSASFQARANYLPRLAGIMSFVKKRVLKTEVDNTLLDGRFIDPVAIRRNMDFPFQPGAKFWL